MMETPKINIFDTESTEQLEEYKAVLLHILNLAENALLSGSQEAVDLEAYNSAETALHQVQAVLDRRAA